MGFRQQGTVFPKLKIAKGEKGEGGVDVLPFIQESEGKSLCWLPPREGNLEYQGKIWEK